MSEIEKLMTDVKKEADSRQGELIRRLAINYPVGGHVCDYQAFSFRRKKLKKMLKKTDEYVATLSNRVKFLFEKLHCGIYLHLTEMLSRRHQCYADEEYKFLERANNLTREINLVETLIESCVRCDVCIACKPRTPLRSATKWQTKRTRTRRNAPT